MKFPHLSWQGSLQELKMIHQNPHIRNEVPTFELLSRVVQETPKTFYCCCPWLSKMEEKSLLLKTAHISEAWPRGLWTTTDLKTFSLRSSFHGTRRHQAGFQRREVTNRFTQLQCYELQWQPAWQNNSKGSITVCMPWWYLTAL